jgi:hypothetical protein
MNTKWRPAMGWMYMMVCIFDFIIFPIMFTIVQFWETQAANDAFRQWQPLTLVGAGLFHMAMGAVLGLATWGRTQEKIGGVAGGALGGSASPTPTPSMGMGSPVTKSAVRTDLTANRVNVTPNAGPSASAGYDLSGGKRADYTDEEADLLPPARG